MPNRSYSTTAMREYAVIPCPKAQLQSSKEAVAGVHRRKVAQGRCKDSSNVLLIASHLTTVVVQGRPRRQICAQAVPMWWEWFRKAGINTRHGVCKTGSAPVNSCGWMQAGSNKMAWSSRRHGFLPNLIKYCGSCSGLAQKRNSVRSPTVRWLT